MKYRAVYLPEAREDAEEIRHYLSQYYENTAKRFFILLKKRIEAIKANPFLAPLYIERPPYRRLVVGDYLVFYIVNEDNGLIEIHRVLHGSRDIGRYLR